MTVQVVTVTSRIPGPSEPYYRYRTWLASLNRLGVDPTVLGMNEEWRGLCTKPRRLRQWLRGGHCTSDLLISSDSYDVVFGAHPDAIGERYNEMFPDQPILFNAERGLFPRGDLAHNFPDPGTPWTYLNSGLFIGPPAKVLTLLEAMQWDDIQDDYKRPDGTWCHPNDQGVYQVYYCCQPVPMVLDTHCRIFQTYSACEADQFDADAEGVTNLITGTRPMVHHFNGNSKDLLMDAFLKKWGLDTA